MKAMIFAAGLGTRLKPITDTLPKALVPVAGKPLLEHVVLKLKQAGFDEIIINIHHFGEQVIDFVRSQKSFGIRIEFSDEREKLLDTGGGIKKAAAFFDDGQPFLVHNVDILSDIDLGQLYEAHLHAQSLATLVVSERNTSRYLLFDSGGDLRGWINRLSGEIKSPDPYFQVAGHRPLAFAGIHVLSPEIFRYMKSFPDKFSIIDFYLSLCNKEKITAFIPPRFRLMDVGKLDSLQQAERFFD
ncbi:nucleotidyltransferase family protein [Limibacterium fermenti]|uniref:nucleotidyltransferase family protein n=1 Tax=Limibacterium fermenti TaxID=3229863 RepID=UPI000E9D6248|nr:mannose-1-phosphate guanyltransferase [Porphyromonadaceae bacterium]